jgi:hypothetical protein
MAWRARSRAWSSSYCEDRAGFKARPRLLIGLCALAAALVAGGPATQAAAVVEHDSIEFEVRPRVCTLSAGDDECKATVHAEWRAPRDESLCLLIVGRPDVKRCWERYSSGVYSLELSFSEDLILELRDPELEQVLAAQAVTVIRETLQLRRKRRQPWNLIY